MKAYLECKEAAKETYGRKKKTAPDSSDPVTGQLIKQAVQNACQQALVYGEDVISIDHRTDFRRCKAIKEKI